MAENFLDDLELIEKIASASVLVIGDVMLDQFVYGKVERISPESPVPVLSIMREEKMLGGAGNTLSNLVHLKSRCKIISVIGDDAQGVQVDGLVRGLGVDANMLIRLPNRPTIIKTRYLAGHQQLLRTDFERIEPITQETQNLILSHVQSLLDGVGCIILSDYGKGMLVPSLIQEIIALANARNIPTVIDPKGCDYSIYAGAFAVTPNKKELSEATQGAPVQTDGDITAAAQKIIQNCNIRAVVATRSKDGISILQNNQDAVHIRSASDIEVFDVSGAGDTVIATIGACLAAGADLVQAGAIANIAGSIVVTKVGTAPIRAQELIAALEGHDSHMDIAQQEMDSDTPLLSRNQRLRHAPILSWQEAKEEILRWRARGMKIGFTNGCFDILHFGHVSYLQEARKRCDRLIVGLNSDSSITILKGADRPVHDEGSRASVLAALGCVDGVVIFGADAVGQDNTACALIELLKPDVYFKGGDYKLHEIPEAPSVSAGGGRVEIMPAYAGHSTTQSIMRLQKSG